MKTIKSKKSYIDFEDLINDEELNNKKCKKNKKKKKNHHKSSKKSSNNKNKKKKRDLEITRDFFELTDKEFKHTKKMYKNDDNFLEKKTFLGKLAQSLNADIKCNINITDETINNILLIASGVLLKIFKK